MPRLAYALALSPLLLALAGPAPADDKMLATPYFPLDVGTTWHYRMGEARYKVKVTKHEKLNNVLAAKLESFGDKDKFLSSEHYAVVSEQEGLKVVRVATNDKPLVPPVPVLRLPAQKHLNVPWNFDSKLDGQVLRGKFRIRSADGEVTVPAGKYRAVLVEGVDLEVLGNKVNLAYQFAEKVGLVKTTMQVGGQTYVADLEKMEAK